MQGLEQGTQLTGADTNMPQVQALPQSCPGNNNPLL